jgi:hypothetical protein
MLAKRLAKNTAGKKAIHTASPPSDESEANRARKIATAIRHRPYGAVARAHTQIGTPNGVGMLSEKGFSQFGTGQRKGG